MELHQVRSFLAVAKHLNFTRAAEDLHIAQPTLTRAILRLEAELEGPLFRRERSNTHLTELGRMMLPHLQATFAASEAAREQARRLQRQQSGFLRLGMSAGIEQRSVAAKVVDAAIGIASLELSIEVDAAPAVERRLMSGEFDAAFLAPIVTTRDRLNLHTIQTDDMVVAFSADHRFADFSSVPIEAVAGEPLVVYSGCQHEETLEKAMVARGLRRLVRCRSNDTRWLAEFIRSGLGCGVVPATLALAHALTHRTLDGVALPLQTAFATVSGRRHSASLLTLMRHIGCARA